MSFDDFVVFIFLTTIANLLDEFRIVRFNFNFQIKAWHSTKNSNFILILLDNQTFLAMSWTSQ